MTRRESEGPLFLVPLRLEALAVRSGAPAVALRRIGMGPVAATAARARLRSEGGEEAVVLLGLGGGLRPGDVPGDVVVATALSVLGAEESLLLPDPAPIVEALRGEGLRARSGPIVSAPRVLSGTEERARAAAQGAHVVDMESYWAAPVGQSRPFVVCRVLVDVPGRELASLSTVPGALVALHALRPAARALRSLSSVTLANEPLLEVGDL